MTWRGRSFAPALGLALIGVVGGAGAAWAAPPPNSADLGISLSAPATATNGELVAWSATVTNSGPSIASPVRVWAAVPSGVVIKGLAAGCALRSHTVICTIPAYPSGATALEVFTGVVSTTGTVTMAVFVDSPAPDPNPANDKSIATTTVAAAAVQPTPGIYTDRAPSRLLSYDGTGPATPTTARTGDWNWDAAITPDGATLYVLATTDGAAAPLAAELYPVDRATGTVGAVIASIPTSAPYSVRRLALSPDGTTAYLAGDGALYPVTIATGAIGASLASGDVRAVAVSPDGAFLYVSIGDHVKKLDARTGRVLADLPLGQLAGAIKISADGTTGYVIGDTTATGSGAQLFRITLDSTTFGIRDSVDIPGGARIDGNGDSRLGLALSPDQQRLYVTGADNVQQDMFAVPVVATTYLSVGTPVVIENGTGWATANDAAFSPDGQTLYTYTEGDQGGGSWVAAIDVVTNTLRSYERGGALNSVLTVPDQAPKAAFVANSACGPSGSSIIFDARGSGPTPGLTYTWDFGDGSPAASSDVAVISHNYKSTGTFTVTLTVTDAAGTSTTRVFDGQTVLRNGGTSADVTAGITVGHLCNGAGRGSGGAAVTPVHH